MKLNLKPSYLWFGGKIGWQVTSFDPKDDPAIGVQSSEMYIDKKSYDKLVDINKSILDSILYEYNSSIQLRELDCGDNSCNFKARGSGGMRTNGGCRCGMNKGNDVAHVLRRVINCVTNLKKEKNNET